MPSPTPDVLAAPGQRIVVVGTTGSGKTTLAQQVSARLGIPHVELDALYWNANWTEAPPEVFRERVAQALKGDAWVVDGNYSSVRDIVWQRAQTIIWLDYRLSLILWRLLRRGVQRAATRVELWNGNRETFRQVFFSRDSLFLWALHTHPQRRRDYTRLSSAPEYQHLAFVHLRSPRSTSRWLAALPAR